MPRRPTNALRGKLTETRTIPLARRGRNPRVAAVVNPGSQCPHCQGIDIVQIGYPEGSTRLTWYQCRGCLKLWFHRIGWPDQCCPQCNELEEPNTFTSDDVVITLRC